MEFLKPCPEAWWAKLDSLVIIQVKLFFLNLNVLKWKNWIKIYTKAIQYYLRIVKLRIAKLHLYKNCYSQFVLVMTQEKWRLIFLVYTNLPSSSSIPFKKIKYFQIHHFNIITLLSIIYVKCKTTTFTIN